MINLHFWKALQNNANIFLYFAAITMNISSFTSGVAFCWSSPVIPKLTSTSNNPLGISLTPDEVSWLASLLSLGSAVGPYLGGYLADKIGRKTSLILMMIPAIICFLTLAFLHYIFLYYIARFILGVCMGTFLTVIPMYIGEVAEIHNRGTLGCFTILYVAIGFVYSFAMGAFLSIQWFNISCTVFPMIFVVIAYFFIPETPSFLIMKGRHEEARQSLTKYRRGDVRKELLEIEKIVNETLHSKGGIRDIFRTKSLLRSLIVTVGLMVVQQLTAVTAITVYLQMIFDSAGSSVAPESAAIIVGIMEVVGVLISSAIVDRLGRRILLLSSSIGTATCLFVLSIYFYLLANLDDVSSISWLPLVTLITFTLVYGVGIGSLPQTVLSEIFPTHIKSAASACTLSACFTSSFVIAKVFPLLVDFVGNWCVFLMFAIGNGLGVFFIWFRLPETKGKTLAEILESFK